MRIKYAQFWHICGLKKKPAVSRIYAENAYAKRETENITKFVDVKGSFFFCPRKIRTRYRNKKAAQKCRYRAVTVTWTGTVGRYCIYWRRRLTALYGILFLPQRYPSARQEQGGSSKLQVTPPPLSFPYALAPDQL